MIFYNGYYYYYFFNLGSPVMEEKSEAMRSEDSSEDNSHIKKMVSVDLILIWLISA